MTPRALLGALLAMSPACGSPAAPVASPPGASAEPSASAAPPAVPSGAPSASAPASAALPGDVQAKPLLASSTPLCTLRGKLVVGTHVLRSAPGGKIVATLLGMPAARVLVLEDGHLFAELTWKGVTLRGYTDEDSLRLRKGKTLGGVWTRQVSGVHVTGTSGMKVHATLQPKLDNVELLGGSDTVDLGCDDLTLDAVTPPSDPPKGKRTAFVKARTKLELSDTEKGKPTLRLTADGSGFQVEVLEKHADRSRIAFEEGADVFVGWVRSSALSAVPKISATKAAALAAEAEGMQMQMLGALGSSGSSPAGAVLVSGAPTIPAGPGEIVAATCDLRLLAKLDGTLVQIGTVNHGAKLRLGAAADLLQPATLDGVDVSGGAMVPALDNVGCEAAK